MISRRTFAKAFALGGAVATVPGVALALRPSTDLMRYNAPRPGLLDLYAEILAHVIEAHGEAIRAMVGTVTASPSGRGFTVSPGELRPFDHLERIQTREELRAKLAEELRQCLATPKSTSATRSTSCGTSSSSPAVPFPTLRATR